MTMPTYVFDQPQPSHSSAGRDAVQAGVGNPHRAMIKRFCLCALAALTAGAILAAIIALETAFYLRTLID